MAKVVVHLFMLLFAFRVTHWLRPGWGTVWLGNYVLCCIRLFVFLLLACLVLTLVIGDMPSSCLTVRASLFLSMVQFREVWPCETLLASLAVSPNITRWFLPQGSNSWLGASYRLAGLTWAQHAQPTFCPVSGMQFVAKLCIINSFTSMRLVLLAAEGISQITDWCTCYVWSPSWLHFGKRQMSQASKL